MIYFVTLVFLLISDVSLDSDIIDDVIYGYYNKLPLDYTNRIIEKFDYVIVVRCNDTENGKDVLLVSCSDCYYDENLAWRTYVKNQQSEYEAKPYGPLIPVDDFVLFDDDKRKNILGYVHWYMSDDGKGTIAEPKFNEDVGYTDLKEIREIDLNNSNDVLWLEQARSAAKKVIRTYDMNYINALKAERESHNENAEEPLIAESLSIPPDEADTVSTTGENSVAAADTQVIAISEEQDAALRNENKESQTQDNTYIYTALIIGVLVFLVLLLVAHALLRYKNKNTKDDVIKE